jgi:hypothetical protein
MMMIVGGVDDGDGQGTTAGGGREEIDSAAEGVPGSPVPMVMFAIMGLSAAWERCALAFGFVLSPSRVIKYCCVLSAPMSG